MMAKTIWECKKTFILTFKFNCNKMEKAMKFYNITPIITYLKEK